MVSLYFLSKVHNMEEERVKKADSHVVLKLCHTRASNTKLVLLKLGKTVNFVNCSGS